MLKRWVRSWTPEPIISLYHRFLSQAAAIWYRHPSEKMIVVGVTGTTGKSTTVSFISQILEHAGYRVGSISTVSIKIGPDEHANTLKMTSLGRFKAQRFLKEMLNVGCTHAIVETTSQGIAQHRHLGINYDVVLLTNLSPEHIEAHGSFENYKNAKLELFRHLTRRPHKSRPAEMEIHNNNGAGTTPGVVPKVIVVNGNDPHANDFLACKADRKIAFEIDPDLEITATGSSFTALGVDMELPLPGKFNVENALAAASVAMALDVPVPLIKEGVEQLHGVPGRLERIDEGQPFTVIVDYAFEPKALQNIYETLSLMSYERLIHVLGSCGGGRDAARRPVLGRMSGQTADITIVTNEDPYDDDPMKIIHEVAAGAREAGKTDDQDLYIVPDRGEAIRKAITLAKSNDLVLITGKGSEPVMAVAHGKLIPWDDRAEARKAIHSIWTQANK